MSEHTIIRKIHPSAVANLIGDFFLCPLWIISLVLSAVVIPNYALYVLGAFVVWLVWRAIRLVGVLIGASYTIYADVVVARVGVIARSISQVRIADIRGMSLRQSLLGRILNYGDVVIGTAATGDAEVVMRDVASPSDVIDSIDELRK